MIAVGRPSSHWRGSAPSLGALAALLLLPLMAPAQEAQAQQGTSIEYTEVTEFQMAGFLGQLLARGAGGEELNAIHVLDTQLRTDSGDASMIFDAEAGRWTILYHDMQAYMTWDLADVREMTAEMNQAMEEARADMDAEMAEWEANQAEMEAAMAEAQAEMEVTVEYVDKGERQTINGYEADRHQVIVRVEDAGDIEGAQEVEGGALVLLLDLWLSDELARAHPLYAGHGEGADNPFAQALLANPEYQEMVEEMTAGFEPGNPGGELTLFAMVDPRIGAAMDEALEELSQLDGMSVRTTTVVALLPPQVEMDTELLVSWQPDSMGDQLQGQASEAAREAARDAARSAVRGLTRGLFGGGDDDEGEDEIEEEDLVIQPLLRYTSEVMDVRSAGMPTADMFTIPEGYSELPYGPGQMGAGAGGDQ